MHQRDYGRIVWWGESLRGGSSWPMDERVDPGARLSFPAWLLLQVAAINARLSAVRATWQRRQLAAEADAIRVVRRTLNLMRPEDFGDDDPIRETPAPFSAAHASGPKTRVRPTWYWRDRDAKRRLDPAWREKERERSRQKRLRAKLSQPAEVKTASR